MNIGIFIINVHHLHLCTYHKGKCWGCKVRMDEEDEVKCIVKMMIGWNDGVHEKTGLVEAHLSKL